jgi:hypothetical protein
MESSLFWTARISHLNLRGRGTGQSALTEISLSTLWRLSHLLQRSDMNGRRNIYYGKVGCCPFLFSVLILELVSLPSKYRVVLIWTFVLKMLVQDLIRCDWHSKWEGCRNSWLHIECMFVLAYSALYPSCSQDFDARS